MRIRLLEGEGLHPSAIEDIDFSLYEYVNDKLNIFTTTNEGWKKVPVTWLMPERAFEIKERKERRDTVGNLILPTISLERTSVIKDLNNKGKYWGYKPQIADSQGGNITLMRRINQNKTSNFANADSLRRTKQENFPRHHQYGAVSGADRNKKNNKIVYEYLTIPQPVYVEVKYNLVLKAEYQQQMNEMLTPFVTRPQTLNYITLKRHNHLYEGFIDSDYNIKNNVSDIGEQERVYEASIGVKVLGHLIGDGKNQIKPIISRRENAVEFKIGRERVIFGDIPDHSDNEGSYRG